MRTLFIIILISIGTLAFSQRENTLPLKALSSPTDTVRVVIDNQSALMLRSVLQGAIYDSLDAHTDTLQVHQDQIAALGDGDVSKVGTPVNNQVGVWTGDGTLEGDDAFTFSTTANVFSIGVVGTAPYMSFGAGATNAELYQYSDASTQILSALYSNIAGNTNTKYWWRYGGTLDAATAAPTNAIVSVNSYSVYDGTSLVLAGTNNFQIDGTVATGDFDTKYTWDLKEGASASGLMLTLGVNGLEYNADHSTDQAANDRWIPDKGYVDGVVTSFTFENGITEAAGNVVLGGALTADVDFTATSTYDFTIGSAISPVPLMTVHSDEQVQLRSVSGTNFGYLTIQPNNFSLTRDVAAGQRSFSMGPAGMFITDTEDTKGLEYAADYSTNFTDRSLVDKGYVGQTISDSLTALLGAAVEGVALADSSGVVAGSYFTGWDAATLQAEVDAKADLITQENQTGTTYTFVLGDAGKLVTLSNAAAITLTIPTNASVAFPINTVITFTQIGAGLVTVDDGSVTMNSYGGADALLGQWAVATLIKTDTDTWLLSGAIE